MDFFFHHLHVPTILPFTPPQPPFSPSKRQQDGVRLSRLRGELMKKAVQVVPEVVVGPPLPMMD